MNSSPIEAFLKRDRLLIICALAALTIISWLYMFYLGDGMKDMNAETMAECCRKMAMPLTGQWTAKEFLMTFIMWAIMMVAMMVPSVAPLLLLFAAVNRKRQEQNSPYVSTGYFLAGYLVIWTGFSLAATALQWIFQYFLLLSPMMISSNNISGSIILFGAGIFQFTSLKNKCLTHCRNPIDFITRHWKEGNRGAFQMGIQHGFYCLGCCWILMLVLFVTGIMNLLWIALISFFVLLEKLVPQHKLVSRIAGIILIATAIWLLI